MSKQWKPDAFATNDKAKLRAAIDRLAVPSNPDESAEDAWARREARSQALSALHDLEAGDPGDDPRVESVRSHRARRAWAQAEWKAHREAGAAPAPDPVSPAEQALVSFARSNAEKDRDRVEWPAWTNLDEKE